MRQPVPTASLLALAGLAGASLGTTGCAAAAHDGYPEAGGAPWEDPRELELDEQGEADVVSAVSYPDRARARWYAVELPGPGSLRAQLAPVTFGRDRPAELGIELYDDAFQLVSAGEGREPGGELTREVEEIEAGRYLVHVYATERDGAADFNLRLAFDQAGEAGSASFPDSVAFVGALPAIPEVDDAPQRRRRRRRPRRREPEPDEPEAIAARIAGVTVTGGGTRIRINRGANHGVAEGWRGRVTSSSGRPIPDGGFTIDRVTPREAFGTVPASVDAVTAARHVRIQAP